MEIKKDYKMFNIGSNDNFMTWRGLFYGYVVKLKNEVIGKSV